MTYVKNINKKNKSGGYVEVTLMINVLPNKKHVELVEGQLVAIKRF